MSKRDPVPRYIFGGEAQLSETHGGAVLRVRVVNISTQGCCIEGQETPAVGQRCELVIEWHGEKFRSETEVRWRKPGGPAGLEFLSMNEAKFAFLSELFPTLRLEPFRPSRTQRSRDAGKPAQRRQKPSRS